MSNELITIEQNAIEVFSEPNGLDPIIEEIKKKARSVVLDPSTEEGRTQIGSLARKIGSTKKVLEGMAMELTEDWRTKTAAVNSEKKRMIEELNALRDEIKAPADEYKARIEARTQLFEDRLQAMLNTADFEGFTEPDSEELSDAIKTLGLLYRVDDDNTDMQWEEFQARADETFEKTEKRLQAKLDARIQYEEEQAELERLRKEEAERKQKEHEERIAREAKEEERKKAEAEQAERERKHREQIEKAEREKKEAEEKRVIAHNTAIDVITRLGNISQDCTVVAIKSRISELEGSMNRDWEEFQEKAQSAYDKSLSDLNDKLTIAEDREEKHQKELQENIKKQAAQQERERLEKQKRKEREEQEAREADMLHRQSVYNEALTGVQGAGIGEADARKILDAIKEGKVPHVKIQY